MSYKCSVFGEVYIACVAGGLLGVVRASERQNCEGLGEEKRLSQQSLAHVIPTKPPAKQAKMLTNKVNKS